MRVRRDNYLMNENLCEISYGQILDAIEETDNNPFKMTIRNQEEWTAIANAVNVGIDAHLEGITDSVFDNGECSVEAGDLCVLLRRLSDGTGGEEDDLEPSMSLMSSILTCLGFDDAGNYVGREAMGLE